MLSVSNKTKELYKADSVHKEMTVKIYDVSATPIVFENDDIYYESFELSESILDGSTMTFMGCISSEMRMTIRNTNNFREEQFNDSKITVEVTPYDKVNTKNQMLPIHMNGSEDIINGIIYTVNEDLSINVVGVAMADSEYEVSHFIAVEEKTLILSGCPSGVGITNIFEGKFLINHPNGTSDSYNDVGNDVQIRLEEGDECVYKIFVAQGQTVNTTFYPMLRATTETATYEPYGTKLVAADTVKLFTGYIDNGQYDQDKSWLKITAYDVLSKLKDFNIWNWYRTAFANGAKSLYSILDSLADYIDVNSGYDFELSETRCPVILEDVKIKKRLNNKEMTAIEFLESFCQLACGMGMIDRDGKFQIIYMNATASGSEIITYYRELTTKDFVATPFTEGITIRTNSDDNGVTVLAPEQYDPTIWNDDTYDTYVIDNDDVNIDIGKYIIESNGIVKKLSAAKRRAILSIDLNNLPTAYYTFKSYELRCNGLPYLECGDRIIYQPTPQDAPIVFNVVSRKLKGIQSMTDIYSFDLDPQKKYGGKYGGSTSKKKDEITSGNVENEESITNMTQLSVTQNGDYNPYDYDAMGFSSVEVNVASGTLITKTITQDGTYNAIDDNAAGYSSVIVNTQSSSKNYYVPWETTRYDAGYKNRRFSHVGMNYWIYNKRYLMRSFPPDTHATLNALTFDGVGFDIKSKDTVYIEGRNHLLPSGHIIGSANSWGWKTTDDIIHYGYNYMFSLNGNTMTAIATLPCPFFYGACIIVSNKIYLFPRSTENPNNYLYISTNFGQTWEIEKTMPFPAEQVIDNAILFHDKLYFFICAPSTGADSISGIYEYNLTNKNITRLNGSSFAYRTDAASICVYKDKIFIAGGKYSADSIYDLNYYCMSFDGQVLRTEEPIPYQKMSEYTQNAYMLERQLEYGALFTDGNELIYYGGGGSSSSYQYSYYFKARYTEY